MARKILYFHGFLGYPGDMEPIYLKDAENISLPYLELLKKNHSYQDFVSSLGDYIDNEFSGDSDIYGVGYSLGGRVLWELKNLFPHFFKKTIFISSRITNYPEKEFNIRQKSVASWIKHVEDKGIDSFISYWESLSLFNGFKIKNYRENNGIEKTEFWTSSMINKVLSDLALNPTSVDKLKKYSNSMYIYGLDDKKYSLEGERLKKQFTVYGVANSGHRCCFESPGLVKSKMKEFINND